ncbi:hypothetical protein [Enterococcus caccae]|uniref:Uncharacterized protein n=1 Tax=Enterococcus caccae ATCC BAA-1240 TaxID=1158612 RepID=R3WI10_9ENTE|nr:MULTISPECIES: hypothetical protein [Enterococcus]EOL47456.1 hypothetical protein UC7_01116 [Enterococcus caccae ATCC BAA-1240]EOT65663.1 hypothetical protein I580_01420 [Enterococcus caccae ATCC BAA-1240]OJG23786.1 hypothetical protein RU98_GL001798 [Enterococcus caccae]
MIDYLWLYILSGIALLSLILFVLTLSRDLFLVKRLKVKKMALFANASLLLLSLMSLSLIIYLFILLKDQINLIG